jgi:hypothetical protein
MPTPLLRGRREPVGAIFCGGEKRKLGGGALARFVL